MVERTHTYTITNTWTGNQGTGTSGYKDFSRDHEATAGGKTAIALSSDPNFLGDPNRYNPEELLVASLSGCHMLWYLHLCAQAKIIVTQYTDEALGEMQEEKDGNGRFTKVTLRPKIVIASGDMDKAHALHDRAHHMCFIANSVNFPVTREPEIVLAG
jgi:organic hydroperoxide reductase OsmC/OhrA